jgi:hypothetical protein
MRVAAAACAIALLVAGARLCHLELLWIEEAYPMAAAAEVLRGKVLYRDIWFDKPPLYALFYTMCGALAGWPLRLLSTAYLLLGCWAVWRLFPKEAARNEPLAAATLLAVYLTFDIPSAVMALAPDLLSVPLHLAAVLLAMRGRAFACGAVCGVALLVNTKALFILAACILWAPRLELLAAALIPNVIAIALLAYAGALGAYWEQVWVWGMRYSADTFVAQPWKEGLLRTANWAGFHAALVVGTIVWLWRERSWRTAAWIALSFLAVCAGWRFFPRYYFVLLPPMLYAGVRGIFAMPRLWRVVTLCTILIPIARFGPRYVTLAAGDRSWSDLALMQDSREAAAIARGAARPGDRLLVWGYRPDVFVFSGLPAATRFLDSQALNGVLADRHLFSATPTAADLALGNVRELETGPPPSIIVDGLGLLNPELAAARFPSLRIANYEVAGRTRMSIVYVAKR